MRIFIGIPLADQIRATILRELKPFRKIGTPIRWTDEQNIHLTLKFIGEVDESLAARIGEALAAAAVVPPFRLRLVGFGKFPAGDELHVFWAGIEESPPLRTLFAKVEEALAPLGIASDARPFHPHLTLGRNKAPSARGEAVRYNFKSLLALLAEKSGLFLGEWAVSAFQLFSSRLTPAGPVYSTLKEIPLGQS